MKKTLLGLAATAALLASGVTFAQAAPANDQLYKAFGEKAGLVLLMDDFVDLVGNILTGANFSASTCRRAPRMPGNATLCAGRRLVPSLLHA